jgi:signal transduction histidine kinase
MSADDGSQITAMAASRPKVQPGLRLQIVLSLAGLMVLAFVPLFFAVASLTQAAMHPAGREIPGRVERGDSAGERRPGPAGPTAGADRGASLVRLVALYMVVFALALVVFAYFSLTRLIVRPIDELVAAADRVASGARTMRVPRSGARELAELSASVRTMAERLIGEEAALILKVDELTETTRRLTQAQAQLVRSERMASVGRLAAGVAHEIGNPIAALMGMEQLLLDGGLSPDEQRDFLSRMQRETDRIHTVVRDLLDFARPEGLGPGQDEVAVPAKVRAVVDDVVALLRPQKQFRDVAVDVDVDEGTMASIPAPRLTQVLLNILLNAGAAVASRGATGGRVVVRARQVEGGRVRIEVEDDGPGVAAAVREKLFEPFVTTKEVGEGTGLGLAVCRGLVESAGGEIGLDAAYEGGARFYVLLPAGSSTAAGAPAQA